jgi:hypothetical protein
MAHYSHLSDAQLIQALKEQNEALQNVNTYQQWLAKGAGLPKDDDARIQTMESNIKLALRLQERIAELEAEQAKRIRG